MRLKTLITAINASKKIIVLQRHSYSTQHYPLRPAVTYVKVAELQMEQ